MSKATRLLQVMQALRSLPPPVTAARLAEEIGVTTRTIYRDIDALRGAGAVIDGEAGYGYVLIEDPALPPMMFSADEVEALVLGLREVREIADPVLADAAQQALSKVQAVLPATLRQQMDHSVLHVKKFNTRAKINADIAALRKATREEFEVEINYSDAQGATTSRRIKPLSLVFMDFNQVVLAWCLLRDDYRAFRLDRIDDLTVTATSFKPHRVPLLRKALEQAAAEGY